MSCWTERPRKAFSSVSLYGSPHPASGSMSSLEAFGTSWELVVGGAWWEVEPVGVEPGGKYFLFSN